MKVLIIGASDTGYHIASEFTEDNYEVTVIDEKQENLQIVQRQLNVATFQGSGTNLAVLERAGIKNTDLFIACTNHDETNLVACLLAQKYDVKQKVAVTRTRSYFSKTVLDKYQRSGINLIINIFHVVAEEIMAVANLASAVEVTSFAKKQVLLVAYRIKADSPLVKIKLKDIDREEDNEFLIACIVRDGKSFIPKGENLIKTDDYVYLLLPRKLLKELNQFLNVKISPTRKVIIAGHNQLAQDIALGLEKSHFDVTMVCAEKWQTVLIKQQFHHRKRFKAVTKEIEDVKEQLKLNISTCSLFIAVNNDDLLNIISGMVATYLGALKTIVIINRPDLVKTSQKVGIDVVLSPRIRTARKLKKMIRGVDDSMDYTTIAETNMEVIEMLANENSEILEKPLKDITFPNNCLVGLIITKNKKVTLPRGDSQIREGDKVILVTMPENVHLLENLIEGKIKTSPLESV